MESEFIALAAAGKEAEWLRNLLFDIKLWPQPMPGFPYTVTVKLLCLELLARYIMENQGTLACDMST